MDDAPEKVTSGPVSSPAVEVQIGNHALDENDYESVPLPSSFTKASSTKQKTKSKGTRGQSRKSQTGPYDEEATFQPGHRSSRNKNLTGFFSPSEIEILEHYKVDFCNTNGLHAETFDEIVQHSRRDRDGTFPVDKSITTQKEFWRNAYDLLPQRDRRSVYRFMRRHFQNSDQKPHHWTEEQDDELEQLYRIYGPRWAFIGKELGRTFDDVVQRWKNQVEHRAKMNRGRWSEEECTRLIQALTTVWQTLKDSGENVGKDIYEMDESYVGWGTISDFIDNARSRQQCADKWRKITTAIRKERANGNPTAVFIYNNDSSTPRAETKTNGTKKRTKRASSPKQRRRRSSPRSSKYVRSEDENDGDSAVSVEQPATDMKGKSRQDKSTKKKKGTQSDEDATPSQNGLANNEASDDGEQEGEEEEEEEDSSTRSSSGPGVISTQTSSEPEIGDTKGRTSRSTRSASSEDDPPRRTSRGQSPIIKNENERAEGGEEEEEDDDDDDDGDDDDDDTSSREEEMPLSTVKREPEDDG
jgi:hypothetical protein